MRLAFLSAGGRRRDGLDVHRSRLRLFVPCRDLLLARRSRSGRWRTRCRLHRGTRWGRFGRPQRGGRGLEGSSGIALERRCLRLVPLGSGELVGGFADGAAFRHAGFARRILTPCAAAPAAPASAAAAPPLAAFRGRPLAAHCGGLARAGAAGRRSRRHRRRHRCWALGVQIAFAFAITITIAWTPVGAIPSALGAAPLGAAPFGAAGFALWTAVALRAAAFTAAAIAASA